MNTFFIPLSTDEIEQARLIGFLSALDEYLPGELTITNLVKVETGNQRLAEMLRLGFEDNHTVQAVINPGVVMQYITPAEILYSAQAQSELETSDQPAGAPYLARDDFDSSMEPPELSSPVNPVETGVAAAAGTGIAALEAEPDPVTSVLDLRPFCPECGRPFIPKRKDQKTCSKSCYMRHYWKTHPEKVKKARETIVAALEPAPSAG